MKRKKPIKNNSCLEAHLRFDDPIAEKIRQDAIKQTRTIPNLLTYLVTKNYAE